MTVVKAADLPVGSIVANQHTAWIKVSKKLPDLGTWLETGDGMSTYDWDPQAALDGGARVLREGAEPSEVAPGSPRQPAYDAVYEVMRTSPARAAGYYEAAVQNARVWRAVEAALDAAGVPKKTTDGLYPRRQAAQ